MFEVVQLNFSLTTHVVTTLIIIYLLYAVHHLKRGLKSTISTLISIDEHLDRLIRIYSDDE